MFIFKIKKQNRNSKHSQNGYAILYTVVIISIIMTIAIGLSNAVNKQLILSSVARDSQSAFYQADTAIECALYLQFNKNNDGNAFDLANNGTEYLCGKDSDGNAIYLYAAYDMGNPNIVYLKQGNVSNSPCFEIVVDESNNTPDNRLIKASGYNVCNPANPKRVERSFEVRY